MPRLTTSISEAADVLRSGGLVAFATETVYGLGANALNEAAVARIFEAKNRPHFDPLIVHIADEAWLPKLVRDVPSAARQLADEFWPGPLTLVLPKTDLVPELVTSGLPSVAVRMPSHPIARELLRQVDLPIAAPSANPFGQISPTTAAHVAESLGDRVDLILDGGACDVGVESTVVMIDSGRATILRQGGLPQEDIERLLGPVDVRTSSSNVAAPSPGMLTQHYAPRTPMLLLSDAREEDIIGKRLGVLLLQPSSVAGVCDIGQSSQGPLRFEAIETLTSDGNLTAAAAHFFAALRRLDQRRLDLILAEPFPSAGLGRALNDRLLRACHR